MGLKLLGMLALAGTVGLGSIAAAEDIGEADAVIKYRKDAMASVGGHVRAMVSVLKGDINDPEGLAIHAAALSAATNAYLLKTSFGQNTDGQGSVETTATAKIWEDWAGFSEQIDLLESTSAEVAALAAAGDLTEFDQLKPMLATCGACHRQKGYREQ